MRFLSLLLFLFVIFSSVAYAQSGTISLTGSVQPSPTQVTMSVNTDVPGDSILVNSDIVTVTIHYSSTDIYSTKLELVGSWDKGLVEGTSNTYVDAFDYVIGSAQTSSEGIVPVVNLQNNTVTWTIPHYSSSIEKTVSFKLKVKQTLPTEQKLSIFLKSGGKVANQTLSEHSFHLFIQPENIVVLTPTPTPTQTPSTAVSITPTSGVSLTNTPTPTIKPLPKLSIDTISIRNTSDTSAQFYIKSSRPTTIKLDYGTSSSALSSSVNDVTLNDVHLVEIPDLRPSTQYYMRVNATDDQQQTIKSDVFIFTTASSSNQIDIQNQNVTISSSQIPLTYEGSTSLIVPQKNLLNVSFSIAHPENIKEIRGKFENAQVLGINIFAAEEVVEETKFLEISPGVFSGQLLTPHVNGQYYLSLNIEDIFGGFYSKNIPYRIYVSSPLTVVDAHSHNPIENALVTISRYDPGKKQYIPIDNAIVYNSRTDEKGIINITLPSGMYSVSIKATGYAPFEKSFELSSSQPYYPQLELVELNSLWDKTLSYTQSIRDTNTFVGQAEDILFASPLALTSLLIALIVLNVLTFLANLGILFHKHLKRHKKESFVEWLVHMVIISFAISAECMTLFMTVGFNKMHPGNLLLWALILVFSLQWAYFLRRNWLLYRLSYD